MLKSLALRFSQFVTLLMLAGCVSKTHNESVVDSSTTRTYTSSTAPASMAIDYPITLPVLDAFLADSAFRVRTKSEAGLSDSEITRVRIAAREESARFEKAESANTQLNQNTSPADYNGSTSEAKAHAISVLDSLIGREKRTKLIAMVEKEWSGMASTGLAASTDSNSVEGARNAVPKDSRIVVNIPAYRMDVFDSGTLIKSYRIAIGYPEFPLPTGLRKATKIIFNPTWTPPDESWVESPNSKVKVGQKIAAGDKLNPLGALKIPIGEPSLIHGGKSPAKLGTFGSHGCVGLVDRDAEDVASRIAHIGGSDLTDSAVMSYSKDMKTTHDLNLHRPVAVELRYETIVADSGSLHIYRDVYDHNTNTRENLVLTLKAYGLTMNDLTSDEQSRVLVALHDMSKDITTNTDTNIVRNIAMTDTSSKTGPQARVKKDTTKDNRPKMTRSIKGQKEIVIPIAALKGRGYPQPVGMSQPPLSNTSRKRLSRQ